MEYYYSSYTIYAPVVITVTNRHTMQASENNIDIIKIHILFKIYNGDLFRKSLTKPTENHKKRFVPPKTETHHRISASSKATSITGDDARIRASFPVSDNAGGCCQSSDIRLRETECKQKLESLAFLATAYAPVWCSAAHLQTLHRVRISLNDIRFP